MLEKRTLTLKVVTGWNGLSFRDLHGIDLLIVGFQPSKCSEEQAQAEWTEKLGQDLDPDYSVAFLKLSQLIGVALIIKKTLAPEILMIRGLKTKVFSSSIIASSMSSSVLGFQIGRHFLTFCSVFQEGQGSKVKENLIKMNKAVCAFFSEKLTDPKCEGIDVPVVHSHFLFGNFGTQLTKVPDSVLDKMKQGSIAELAELDELVQAINSHKM